VSKSIDDTAREAPGVRTSFSGEGRSKRIGKMYRIARVLCGKFGTQLRATIDLWHQQHLSRSFSNCRCQSPTSKELINWLKGAKKIEKVAPQLVFLDERLPFSTDFQ
jgi:hypothetical protein